MIAEHAAQSFDAAAIRRGLADLPRADNHAPGQDVDASSVYVVQGHRNALDPDRALVVGNRGMGKSFWAHALANPDVREVAAERFHQPQLRALSVEIGFNASEQAGGVAPSLDTVRQVARDHRDTEGIWRAVIARAAAGVAGQELPSTFAELVTWVEADAERYARLVTTADSNT